MSRAYFFVNNQKQISKNSLFSCKSHIFSKNPHVKMAEYPPLLQTGGILSVSWRDMNMTEQGHWTKHWLGLLMQRGWNHGITTLNVTKHLNISKYYLNSVLAASWHKLTFARPELGCHAEVGGQLPASGRRGTSGDIITFNRPLLCKMRLYTGFGFWAETLCFPCNDQWKFCII